MSDSLSQDETGEVVHSGTREQIGPYRILQRIGEGGFGYVYEAEQEHPVRRRVALKVIKLGMDTGQVIARFEAERQALAMMDHPHIARVLDAGATDEGRPYFVMELVRGEPISTYCDRHTLSIIERLNLFDQVCLAVQHAHTKGIIHRDIKPSNVLVSTQDELPFAKVIDFGIAKATSSRLTDKTLFTEMHQMIGTPLYMSPEQAEGSPDIDTRTDIYALGVLLYELLTGTTPVEAGTLKASTLQEFLRIIREMEPARPSTRLSQSVATLASVASKRRTEPQRLTAVVRGELDWIVMKAIEKDRSRRYETANALAMDVRRYLAGEPVRAAPPSTMYQVRKLALRHKGSVASGAAIAVLLVALAVTMAVQARRVGQERDRAAAEAAKASAINSFLLDALGAADPWSKGSRNVSLLDALRQAQDKARTSFVDQPLVEASVLQTIGTTFSNLAEFPESEKALRASLDLRVKAAGPKSAEAAESLSALSEMYTLSKKHAEAETCAREELEIVRGIHGAESVEAAAAMYRLGMAQSGGGKVKEAKATAEQILRIVRGAAAAGKPQAAKVETDALLILVGVAVIEEDYPKLLALTRERLALSKKNQGDRHPEVAQAQSDVALGQMYAGDLAGAERTYLEVIDLDIAFLGPDHPEVASARENLGQVYMKRGQLDKTLKNLAVVLAMRRKALGDDAEPVARTLSNIGTVYLRAGNFEASVANYREAIERLSKKLGPDHPDVGTTLAGLGQAYRKLGKFPESEAAFKRALDIQVKALGEDNVVTQRTIKALAGLYTDWKRPAQAAAYTARLKPAE